LHAEEFPSRSQLLLTLANLETQALSRVMHWVTPTGLQFDGSGKDEFPVNF